jgi:glycosyltransferase involved in cell wall biosynthesis
LPVIDPYFSIIIPTLQEEKYILRTLDQFTDCLRNKFNYEVIVSDGGSTDATVQLARNRADLLLEHTASSHQTISMGRNIGARNAKGKIFVFLNADTIIEQPDLFFRVVCDILKNERIIAATCKVNIYKEEERFSDRLFHNFFNYYFWLLNIIGIGMGRGECQIVRRDEFFNVGGYDEQLAAGEDFNLFVKLCRHGEIAFIPSLIARESPRRFRKFGYRKIVFQWFMNSLSVLLRGKSMSDHWEPVR